MKPAKFAYFQPRNAHEAVRMIAAAGEDARFLAGGQSLVPMMNFRLARPGALIDLSRCEDLTYIRRDRDVLRLGAMVRQYDAEMSDDVQSHCPLIAAALALAGPATIRNQATVGGTIANGYPVAQLPVVAVCLDAEMILISAGGERSVSANAFFMAGMVTDIAQGELLRELVFPVLGPRTRYSIVESGNHAGGAALAIVAACGAIRAGGAWENISVAAAGLCPVPRRLGAVEQAFVDGGTPEALKAAFRTDLQVIDEAGEAEEDDVGRRDLVWALIESALARLNAPQPASEFMA
jgi:aerobic carbon-monoxide dehydrogenase medium subunit